MTGLNSQLDKHTCAHNGGDELSILSLMMWFTKLYSVCNTGILFAKLTVLCFRQTDESHYTHTLLS